MLWLKTEDYPILYKVDVVDLICFFYFFYIKHFFTTKVMFYSWMKIMSLIKRANGDEVHKKNEEKKNTLDCRDFEVPL